MTKQISRRAIVGLFASGVAAATVGWPRRHASAADAKDSVTIAWPSDIVTWDPNQRFTPDAQSIFKAVYDQPLDQNPDLSLRPNVIKSWTVSADGLRIDVELRNDIVWHNGDKLTAEDFRYTFFERVRKYPDLKLDIGNSWKEISNIEVQSATNAVVTLSAPKPTAPQWFSFLGSYVVPMKYMEQVGVEGFRQKPVGSGPYRLVEYQLNSRIVLERFEQYWGPKPKIKRVIYEIIKDPSARVAAIESGKADLVINVPVREATRLNKVAGLASDLDPITRVILFQCRNDLGFADENVRLAAHHAIDKQALSKAFYEGAAVPLSMLSVPGTPAYDASFKFPYDPAKATALLAKSGHSPQNPAKIKMAATNGHFPSDFDIARAIVAMWKKVGIEAELEAIEYPKYFELNRGNKLPEATLYSWDNATGDPEIFAGYLLHPKRPFSAWKGMDVGEKLIEIATIVDYDKRVQAYKEVEKFAIARGATIPLLQSVTTVARKASLGYRKYGNGWILPQTMDWA
jgi:peptide/nickel transport system substrate-binding protein